MRALVYCTFTAELLDSFQKVSVFPACLHLKELPIGAALFLEVAIARFAQADVEKRFVSALNRGFRWKARQFGHHAHKADGRHTGDVGVGFRHVADLLADLADVRADVKTEDPGRAGGWRMEA